MNPLLIGVMGYISRFCCVDVKKKSLHLACERYSVYLLHAHSVMLCLKYILYVEPYFLRCLFFFLYDNALIVITEHDFIVWFNEGQEIEESTALTRNI